MQIQSSLSLFISTISFCRYLAQIENGEEPKSITLSTAATNEGILLSDKELE